MSSIIDAKKQETSEQESETNKKTGERAVQFVKSVSNNILMMSVYISISLVTVYLCKLAQSNILPTNTFTTPFTIDPSKRRQIDEIDINIFSCGTKSNKIKFPLDKNPKYKLIELVRQLKNATEYSIFYFFGSVIEEFIAFNYSFVNIAYNTINELLPEPAVFLLGPILTISTLSVLFGVNFIFVWIKWILSLGELFKEKENKGSKWTTKSFGISYLLSIAMAVFLFCISGVSLVLPFILFPAITLSLITFKGVMNGGIVTIGDILKRGVSHYKKIIVWIFTIFMLSSAFKSFGNSGLGVGIVIVLLVYLKKIATISVNGDKVGLFESFPSKYMSPHVSYKQAVKTV